MRAQKSYQCRWCGESIPLASECVYYPRADVALHVACAAALRRLLAERPDVHKSPMVRFLAILAGAGLALLVLAVVVDYFNHDLILWAGDVLFNPRPWLD